MCVLYLCVLHRGFAGAQGELLMNVVCLREYVCVFKEFCVCVVSVCSPSRSCRSTR